MKTVGYRINTEDLDGPWNMAIDEVLWGAAACGTPFLRLYGWADRPSVSLGYFQSWKELRDVPRWRGIPFVRRLTGGGAIVHDHDLSYSLALPVTLAPRTDCLYRRVHRAIARALGELGIPATAADHLAAADGNSPSLCFHRSDRYAIRVQGRKVLGSAQRRCHGSVLMHGSLLLARSNLAPEIPGLQEITGLTLDGSVLEAALVRAIQTDLEAELQPADLPVDLRCQAMSLANEKYRSASWNEQR